MHNKPSDINAFSSNDIKNIINLYKKKKKLIFDFCICLF